MADPTPYKRSYSFTNHQEDAPDNPLPGNRLDVELDEIADKSEALVRRVNAGLKVGLNQEDLEKVADNMDFVIFAGQNIADIRAAPAAAAASAAAAVAAQASAAAAAEDAAQVADDKEAAEAAATQSGSNAAAAEAAFIGAVSASYNFSDMAALRASTISFPAGSVLVSRSGGFSWRVLPTTATAYDTISDGGHNKLDLIGPWTSKAFPSAADFAASVRRRAADLVATGERLQVAFGETVSVPVNPSTQNLQAYWDYMTLKHDVQQGGYLKLEIADGLHDVSTFLDAANGSRVIMEATGPALAFNIASVVYTSVGAGVWDARITISSGSLPAYLATGSGAVVGVQNPVGNGTPDAVAQGMHVVTRHSATSITCRIVSRGDAPLVSMTTPTAGTSLGVTQNQLIVPRACIRANSAGWTPGGVGNIEGFINARNGARVQISGLGLSYNGVADGHEMLFARDANSSIVVRDSTVVVGDCTILTRSAYGGAIHCEYAFLGTGTTGSVVWQGVASGCTFYAIRSMIGGGEGEIVSATADCEAFITLSVLTGAHTAFRPTYPNASINIANCRIRHCGTVAQPTRGVVYIDSGTSIEYCGTPFLVSGSNFGRVEGNPSMANNTNAPITPNAVQANGGVWLSGTGRSFIPQDQYIGRFAGALDFPTISAGGFADLTIAAPGAQPGDDCSIAQKFRTTQNVNYMAICDTANQITVRAQNVSGGSIDPTAFTAVVVVRRNL